YDGRLPEALERWQRLVQDEPLNIEAQQRTAQLLADLQGPEAAIDHLEAAAQRFAHHSGLQELLYHRLQAHDPDRAERALRRVIELNPANVWAERELGFHLVSFNRVDEAFACLEQALALEPRHAAALHLAAEVALKRGEVD